jgi:hypothetical protein
LISTNGERHHHPDTEALARLIVDAPIPPTFYFNYPSARVLRWARAANLGVGKFTVKHPPLVGMTFPPAHDDHDH